MRQRPRKSTLFVLITLGLLRYLDRPPLDLSKLFTERRNILKNSVLSAASSVALTSDIWSGNAKEDYISVVAHYVSAD